MTRAERTLLRYERAGEVFGTLTVLLMLAAIWFRPEDLQWRLGGTAAVCLLMFVLCQFAVEDLEKEIKKVRSEAARQERERPGFYVRDDEGVVVVPAALSGRDSEGEAL